MQPKTPNPGSDEAIKLGCTCPVDDNCNGQGFSGGKNGSKLFWRSSDCPIHCFKHQEKHSAKEHRARIA